MGNIKRLFCFLMVFGLSGMLFARQISIQIVQHDAINDSVRENSLQLEDELMTVFFESGYIVTNSPAVTSKSEETDTALIKTGMGEAYDGCSEYFVQLRLFYDEPKNDLQKVDWTLYSVITGKKIKESSVKEIAVTKKNTKDLHKLSIELISKINEAIKA